TLVTFNGTVVGVGLLPPFPLPSPLPQAARPRPSTKKKRTMLQNLRKEPCCPNICLPWLDKHHSMNQPHSSTTPEPGLWCRQDARWLRFSGGYREDLTDGSQRPLLVPQVAHGL